MSDALTSVREEGYQAYLSGLTIMTNPYDYDRDWTNWHSWVKGYKDAQADNSSTGE